MRKLFLLTLFAVSSYYLSHNLPTVTPDEGVTAARIIPISESAVSNNNSRFLTRSNFEDVVRKMYGDIGLSTYALDYEVFRLAVIGYYSLEQQNALSEKGLMTIINFAQPSTEKRFYTIDMREMKVKYHTYVAHGRNTGENVAKHFSNVPHSNQSSLGFYVTSETYVGSKGYSLRLDGMEKSVNDNIRSRAVVIHAADYVSEKWIKQYGRLGRSQGCPALPPHLSREVIDTIKDKTAIFTYFPDQDYLSTSSYLQVEALFKYLDKQPLDLVARPLSIVKS